MSDTSQGPGWWRASNGLWYPPEAKPGPRQPTAPARRPPGVPDTAPRIDPGVQEPFTPRRVEPLELDREERRRRSGRPPSDDHRGGAAWRWLGLAALVLVFGGIGTWLAVTADDDGDDAASATETTAGVDDGSDTPETTADTEPATTTAADEVSVFDLAVGDCFTAAPTDDDGGALVTTAAIVDCDEPHLAEVILIGELPNPAGEPFPGVEARDEAAEQLCQPAFDDYVGVPLAASELGLLWLAPTEETWEDQDDREVTCAVQSLDGEPLVGSVRDSQR